MNTFTDFVGIQSDLWMEKNQFGPIECRIIRSLMDLFMKLARRCWTLWMVMSATSREMFWRKFNFIDVNVEWELEKWIQIQCQHLATSVFKKNCILVLVMDWFYDWKLLMAKDSKTCQKWKILIGNVPINQIPLSFNHFGFRSQFIKCIAKCRLSLSMAKVKSLCLSVYLIIFTLS